MVKAMESNLARLYALLFVFGTAAAFRPSKETGRERDYTHESITEKAVYKAVAIYIATHVTTGVYDLDNIDSLKVIQETYANNRDALQKFADDLVAIIKANNNAQRNYGGDAMRTMNSEQIPQGNILLQSLRERILENAKQIEPHWDIIRSLIGEYLFTLQSFYSNTNWVEMHGNETCTELGIKGEQIMPTAPTSVATCKGCNDTVEALLQGSCDDNILVNGKHLTSGYTSYQHIVKPLGHWPSEQGKCNHGGQYDQTTNIPAVGGINKETSDPSLSPHYDLHSLAGEAAVKATVEFLVGNGTGLLDILGPTLFAYILDLNYVNPCYNCFSPSLSLVFVVDDTGSMSGEIFATRQIMVNIVNQAIQYGADGPKNYVLATFNDPDTTVQKTTNGQEIKRWVQNLTAHGGGDCPEMAMNGMLKAIKAAERGSCLIFFTDADAKDEELSNDVITLAKEKDIRFALFLRRSCSSRKRRDATDIQPKDVECINKNPPKTGTRRRRALDIFSLIAKETSGSVYHVTTSTLESTLGKLVEQNMGIKNLNVYSFTMLSGSMQIPIDSDLSLFMVEIKGVSSSSAITLTRPDGSVQTYSGDSSMDDIGRNTIILSIKDVIPGMYKLKDTAGSNWDVAVTGSGNIDFTHKFLEEVRGLKFEISGSNPVAGSSLTIRVTVTGLTNETKITAIVLRGQDGTSLVNLPVSDVSTDSERTFTSDITVPIQDFYVTIEGQRSSLPLRRTTREMVEPVTGKLEILPGSGNIVPRKKESVHVKVTNSGSVVQTFLVQASDSQRFLTGSTSVSVTLSPHEEKEIDFQLLATIPSSITTLTVLLKIGSTTIQTEKRNLMVNSMSVATVSPPTIDVKYKSHDCSVDSLNYYNCTRQTWTASMTVQFEANMTSELVSPSDVNFTYEYTTSDGRQMNASISGDCCTPKASILLIDDAFNRAKETFDFTGGETFSTNVSISDLFQTDPEVSDVRNNQDNSPDFTSIAIVAGTVGGVALVTTIATTTFLLVRAGSKVTKHEFNDIYKSHKRPDKNGKQTFLKSRGRFSPK